MGQCHGLLANIHEAAQNYCKLQNILVWSLGFIVAEICLQTCKLSKIIDQEVNQRNLEIKQNNCFFLETVICLHYLICINLPFLGQHASYCFNASVSWCENACCHKVEASKLVPRPWLNIAMEAKKWFLSISCRIF